MILRSSIDGKSRACVYLEVGNTNSATASLESFARGIKKYGVPMHTRSDKGGENVLVARFMLSIRGMNAHFTGRSVHNQRLTPVNSIQVENVWEQLMNDLFQLRIERFWRDVYRITGIYYKLFSTLEFEGRLNIDNPNHIFVLHFVFIPRINASLEEFRQGWNDHPLSSEQSYTPNQLMLIESSPTNLEISQVNDD